MPGESKSLFGGKAADPAEACSLLRTLLQISQLHSEAVC